jgi:hypothetical protein
MSAVSHPPKTTVQDRRWMRTSTSLNHLLKHCLKTPNPFTQSGCGRITAASGKAAEFRVRAQGARANGCTSEQVQDVLLLVAMCCGIPAAIETTPDRGGNLFGYLPPGGPHKT